MVTLVATKLPADLSTSKPMAIPSSGRDGRTQMASQSVLQDSPRQVDLQKGVSKRLALLPPPQLDPPSIDSDSDALACDASKEPKKSFNKPVKEIMFKEGRVFDFEEDWQAAGWKGSELTTDPSTSQPVASSYSDRDGRTQKASRSVLQDSPRPVYLQEGGSKNYFPLIPSAEDAPATAPDSDKRDCDVNKQSKKSFNKLVKEILYEENRIFEFDEDWRAAGWKGEE